MDVLEVVDRCVRIERAVSEIYDQLSRCFPKDAKFREFWEGLAEDERQHAHKLATWRTLLELSPEDRRPEADGFDSTLPELENLVRECRKQAQAVQSPDEAFTIALKLERSELDVIYVTLIQSSPIRRFPDVAETRRHELGRHHTALLREIQRRSRNERNLYEAALIAADP